MKRFSWSRNHQAFTLVELLMVIAILMAFMALLLPALNSAREHGRRARCLSNMHQLGIAMGMYADQNDGKLPPYLYATQKQVDNNGIPYYQVSIKTGWSIGDVGMLGHSDILLCPSDKNPSLINTTDAEGKSIIVPTSYSYNFELFMVGAGIQSVDSSKTVLIFDGKPELATSGIWGGQTAASYAMNDGGSGDVTSGGGVAIMGANGGGYCAVCKDDDAKQFNAQLIDRRHFNRANVIFLDGHGEWLGSLPSSGL